MSESRLSLFADLDEAVRHLAPAKSSKTDLYDQFDLMRVIKDGAPLRVIGKAGEHLAAFVLQPFGKVLWITAAAGAAGEPLCPVIDQHAVDQARRGGYHRLMFRTERPGLVVKAQNLGWDLVRKVGRSHYMKKEIQR